MVKSPYHAGSVALAILNAVQPRNEFEALLATQMIATHNQAMYSHELAGGPRQTPQGRQTHITSAAKMSRTYLSPLETLHRYRNGVRQTVEVKHIHAEDDRTFAGTSQEGTIDQATSENTPDGQATSIPVTSDQLCGTDRDMRSRQGRLLP